MDESTPDGLARGADDAFELFAVMSGIAALVLFTEGGMQPVVNGTWLPMPVLVAVGLGLLLVAWSWSVPLFVAFWATYTYFLLLNFPQNNTNQTLTFFVGAAILWAAASSMRRVRGVHVPRSMLFLELAPAVRLCVVGLYFWTVWHKINSDFLNPAVSCAASLTGDMLRAVGLNGLPDVLAPASVMMTLLVEGFLPIGLFFGRTQRATVLVGLVFHWMLGVAGYYGFSATMMALLPLFFSPSDLRRLLPRNRRLFVPIGFVLLLLMAVAELAGGVDPTAIQKFLWLAMPAAVAAIWWTNRGLPRVGDEPPAVWELLRRPRPIYLVPLVLFLNGVSPYVGFKTEYSYAMYSNLRTEGGRTNHLIWRTPLRLARYQTDLVRVLEGSDPALISHLGGRPITKFELTSRLWRVAHEQRKTNVRLVLDANGERHEYPAAELVPELTVRPGFLERRLLRFRNIVPALAGRCPH